MSKTALLDILPGERRKTLMHQEDGKTYVESRQDVEHIVEAAKIICDQPPGKDFRHVGFVPDAVLNAAFAEGWFHDKAKWKRWLNDPANRDFRTHGGAL
jgi:hypothetical protein